MLKGENEEIVILATKELIPTLGAKCQLRVIPVQEMTGAVDFDHQIMRGHKDVTIKKPDVILVLAIVAPFVDQFPEQRLLRTSPDFLFY